MKLTRISFLFLFLFLFVPSVSNAQAVPSSVKKEILTYLKTTGYCDSPQMKIYVQSIKISPSKFGFEGVCDYGGGITVLYGKTKSGIKKLIEVERGMNGYFYAEKTISKGYYDMSHSERSGTEIFVTTYRWNGTRYVAGKQRQVQ